MNQTNSKNKTAYQQTIDYLFEQLPMFQNKGEKAFNPSLKNTVALCNHLNNPQNTFKSIHVAGTNGKGSTSHMLASVLQAAGYKVGLYTSPHLKDFRERIKINGQYIPKNAVIHFVKKHKTIFESIKPSFFEMTVAMAFDYFARKQVDIAVIEVGLGGRFDSTNLVTPLVSVITNIGYDHVNILGDTLPKIAFEKAGIIKQNVPVVISETHKETVEVFKKVAQENNTPILFADKEYTIASVENKMNVKPLLKVEIGDSTYELDLIGGYQAKNVLGVLKTIEIIKKQGFHISKSDLMSGLKNTIANTGLMGRWQVLSQKPLVICETSHNEDGINQTLLQLKTINYSKLHIVLGFVKDKDVTKMLALLPKNATYYFCNASIERALPVKELKKLALNYDLQGNSFETPQKALQVAKNNAELTDLVLVTGSIFLIAEII